MKKVFIFSFLFISACAQFEPFVDARHEAGQPTMVGQSTPDRAAICYNPLWSNMEQVENLAKESCAQTKRKIQFDTKKYFSCSLVTPATAFYKCI